MGSSGSPILNLNNKVIGIHQDNFNKGTFLNYPIKEFIKIFKSFNNDNYINIERNEMLLNEFKQKYDLNIEDTKIDFLDLSFKILNKELLEDLIKIESKKLEKLSIDNNGLSDINILEKVNFKELKQLDLYANDLSDINVLEKVRFEKLEIYIKFR